MPDGGIDEDFPHVVRAVDSLVRAGAIAPHIVVGIPNTERRRDLTGPTRIKSDSSIAPHVGGSAAFRAFIRDELFPAIDARYRTTNDRAIVGESLAGLFVVETFLRDPAMFDRYVAFDPSLWWNGGALVDSAAGLLPETTDGAPASRLFIAASSDDIGDQTTRFATILHRAAPKDGGPPRSRDCCAVLPPHQGSRSRPRMALRVISLQGSATVAFGGKQTSTGRQA